MATKEEIIAAIKGMDANEKKEVARLLQIKQENQAEIDKG